MQRIRFDSGGWCPYHARAMGIPLRDRRTVAEWVSFGQVIEIKEEISLFSNLVDALEQEQIAVGVALAESDWRNDAVTGQLQFAYLDAESRIPALTGNVATTVTAICQRCLEPFRLTLEVEPRLLLLDSDEAVSGYEEYDVWEVPEPTLRLADVVDELLVMTMPFAPAHPDPNDCKALLSTSADDNDETTRPFAALREQMEQN